MLFFLILLVGAAVVAVLLVRTLRSEQVVSDRIPRAEFPWSSGQRAEKPRATGPDDDPDFLRELDEKVRDQEDPPERS
ncbi:hypothetical protein ACFU8R_20975 [Pseudonocardia alni]|jgi:hypothetical protein|uniref:Uncharacterized protein n=1 Tax=Pseudonocardia alni TaxID=33907 RepID=A0A852WAS9_PSEA5|nr:MULTISPECIES: hypothetical protein [Pseudonocardia]OJG05626.1 hypothetical protein BG618_03226 [Pseudonocardia autotrophica]MCO7197189.1 hypothetical protein [Pseudonocardia sp. McavD-2-B]MYW73074.1 hypothetical protein [Pseudonocardia sp. SID8383]NYG03435.1 hypothetical protein [Pseudonocardia antarctica]PKB31047.1 hypothetical protein ATL51_2728 [Pseudonocardia alni]